MQYRSEIDGLRALAVLPVILFHAGFSYFQGGYVGVDVFFVISGYLITTILIEDLKSERFSLGRFYERRARRILPALFFMILICLPLSWLWMLPSQMKDFSESIISVIFFGSNILFWLETGYFSGAAELKPLLHTWSLAVEEQYYLLFPLFLAFVWKLPRLSVRWTLFCLALISLAMCEYASSNMPTANFYLLPTRAWELLAGSLCACYAINVKRWTQNVLSLIGLVMILSSIFIFSEETRFPSLNTLLPVGGAVLLILFCEKGTWAAKLLSFRPLVGIGLISYSAYLWHQPLFAFARLRSSVEPTSSVYLSLVILTFLIAYFSWRFVEVPFRRTSRPFLPARRKVFGASITASLVFLTFGIAGNVSLGFSDREAGGVNLAQLEDRVRGNVGLDRVCNHGFVVDPKCRTSEKPKILLWGDSFAMHLSEALLSDEGTHSFIQHTMSSCSPVLGLAHTTRLFAQAWVDKCISFNDQVFEWLQQNESVEIVVLSSPYGGLLHNPAITRDGSEVYSQQLHDQTVLANYIIKTVEKIRELGLRVVIVSPTPRSGVNIGQCLVRVAMFGGPENLCGFTLDQDALARKLLERVQEQVPVIWLSDLICSDGFCNPIQEGTFLYRDYGHLSYEGAAYLGKQHALPKKILACAK